MADPKLWIKLEKNKRAELAPEFEIGNMVGPTTGIWFRGGGHHVGAIDIARHGILEAVCVLSCA